MKRLFPLLVILFFSGCTKEQDLNSVTGTWTLTQINSGPPSSSVLLSRTEFSVEFKKNDTLVILGPKPNYSFLQNFNRYKMLTDERIRFFNDTTQEEMFASFHIDDNLSLSYEVGCIYEEKFIRR
jgi:hypothetical protein